MTQIMQTDREPISEEEKLRRGTEFMNLCFKKVEQQTYLMREVVFNTETTGLNSKTNRIVEIGCVELVNSIPSGREFHTYLRPDDECMPADALEIHGLSQEFLSDKPRFSEVVTELLEFLDGACLVAHNASFDVSFLNAELERVDYPPFAGEVLDTVRLARRKYPGSSVSLDALCDRFGINLSARKKHGALLDAHLLSEVYMELTGNRQPSLEIIQEQPVADILENARNAILERNSRHGSSKVVHTLVANLWSQLLGKEITARQVMLMMILVKTARIQCGSLKTTEHTEDIAGYAQLLESLDETE